MNQIRIANTQEGRDVFAAHRASFDELGVSWAYNPVGYVPEGWKKNFDIAMDAAGQFQSALSTDPNSALPAMLTTWIDPEPYKVLFAPNNASQVLGERLMGDWTDDTAMFPVSESVGETSSYGDYNENGVADANFNYPQRQAYPFQTVLSYGDKEAARVARMRLNWVAEKQGSATLLLDKAMNLTWFFGVGGLQNYGLINDPHLPAALTPTTKAAGGTAWFTAGGAPNATANEVYNDIVELFQNLVAANAGLVDEDSALTLALSPASAVALTFTNSFNVNVRTLIKENFPKMRIVKAVQYGALSATNPQGVAAGNLVQMIADAVEGQKAGYCSFNAKLRSFPIIRAMSSFRQKMMSSSWGAIIRYPAAFQGMVGV